jgi:predicted HicB family RNase H-like nuclease
METKTINIKIPIETHTLLKTLAAQQKTTLKKLMIETLTKKVK